MSGCDGTFSFEDWMLGGSKLTGYEGVNAFKRISWVYSCINAIATTTSGAPIGFYRGDFVDANKINDPDDPINLLFEPPKPPNVPSFRELIYRTFIHLGFEGVVYWVFHRKKGVVVEVETKSRTVLRPIFDGVADPDNLIGWAESQSTGNPKIYPLNDVLPIRYYDPSDPLGGLAPLTAARMSIESEVSIAGWNSAFFKTGMKNPLLIKAKGQLTRDQKNELKKEIVNYYSGIAGGQSALLLQGNVEAEGLQIQSKDVDFIQGKKLNREEIISIFQVPPSIVGIYEYSNYSNVREQRRIFWEHALLPKMNVILDLLQINIINREFPGINARWETSELPALQTDPVEAAPSVKIYYEMGLDFQSISNIVNLPQLADANIRKDFENSKQPQKNDTLNSNDAQPLLESISPFINKQNDFEHSILKLDNALSSYFDGFMKSKTHNPDIWETLWADIVGKTLKNIAFDFFEQFRSNYNLQNDYNLIRCVDSYIIRTYHFPKVCFDLLDDQKALEAFISHQSLLARTLANGIKENVKFEMLENSGVKRVLWVSGDSQHSHLNGQIISLGKSFTKGFEFKHPHDKSVPIDHVLGCSCTLEPVL